MGQLITNPILDEGPSVVLTHIHRLANGLLTGRSLVRDDGMHFHLMSDGTLTEPSIQPEGMDHNHGGGMSGPIDVSSRPDMNRIQGVEIFSVGVWNGDKYTVADLQLMVDAFNENAEGFRPVLKLGHTDKQKLLQKDGLPAAGWIERLFVRGDKLLADFMDVPKKIFELIQNKAYRKVSSEIYWDIKIHDRTFKRMLGAVALLGADNPGVMNLKDILANYNFKDFSHLKSYSYDINKQINNNNKESIMDKTEKEITLERDLSDSKKANDVLAKQAKEYTAKKEADEKELKELRDYKIDQAARTVAAEKKAYDAEVDAFVTELQSEKLASKAMKPYIVELMANDKKSYSIEDKEKSKKEIIKEMLKLFSGASKVNFEDNSVDGEQKNNKQDDEKKINEYMKENKVDYGTAYRALAHEFEPEKVKDSVEDEE